ncbi:kinase-like protein, partial [Rickenella mellea]
QLIRGVTFLHENGVAHGDLKPDNILIDPTTRRLVIIDFSLSTRFDGTDDWVEGYSGTPGWTAPEVGEYGGFSKPYRATLADRWACGKLI